MASNAPSTAASTEQPAHDPTEYQPHPDDRRGGGGGSKPNKGKATTKGGAEGKGDAKGKGGAKGKGSAEGNRKGGGTKTKTKGKGKNAPALPTRCSNCDEEAPLRRCLQCGVVAYCGEKCQREHWKHGGHKKACKAYVLSKTVQAKILRDSRKAFDAHQCLICLEPPANPTSLPRGHSFCTGCVSELRAQGVSEVCPLCRARLPPGREKLFELAERVRAKTIRVVGTNREWPPLSASQQKEWDGALVMFEEAMAQVSGALVSW